MGSAIVAACLAACTPATRELTATTPAAEPVVKKQVSETKLANLVGPNEPAPRQKPRIAGKTVVASTAEVEKPTTQKETTPENKENKTTRTQDNKSEEAPVAVAAVNAPTVSKPAKTKAIDQKKSDETVLAKADAEKAKPKAPNKAAKEADQKEPSKTAQPEKKQIATASKQNELAIVAPARSSVTALLPEQEKKPRAKKRRSWFQRLTETSPTEADEAREKRRAKRRQRRLASINSNEITNSDIQSETEPGRKRRGILRELPGVRLKGIEREPEKPTIRGTLKGYISHTLANSRVQTKCFPRQLKLVLQKVYSRYGKKPEVSSGYRSAAYNRRIGGARKSYHTRCMAADIKVAGVDKYRLARFLRSMPGIGGVGVYGCKGVVHVDMGPRRDWYYRCRSRRRRG